MYMSPIERLAGPDVSSENTVDPLQQDELGFATCIQELAKGQAKATVAASFA